MTPGPPARRRLADGVSPGHAREVLTDDDRRVEDIMLRVRLADGIPLTHVDDRGAKQALEDGLLVPEAYANGQLILNLRGRLLADAVIRDIV